MPTLLAWITLPNAMQTGFSSLAGLLGGEERVRVWREGDRVCTAAQRADGRRCPQQCGVQT
ncbi:hypothetical protein G3W24_26995 [Klebsiella pneumoniae]|nr:hypothetical protein [Klebsiella pneumoniae]